MAARKKWPIGGWRPGAGRKPVFRDPVTLTFDLEREELVALTELARERGEPRAVLLRRTIQRLVASAARRRAR
jgi:hypothetical protein